MRNPASSWNTTTHSQITKRVLKGTLNNWKLRRDNQIHGPSSTQKSCHHLHRFWKSFRQCKSTTAHGKTQQLQPSQLPTSNHPLYFKKDNHGHWKSASDYWKRCSARIKTEPNIILIYINDLLIELEQEGFPPLAFADDVAVLVQDLSSMRKAINILEKWANNNYIKINSAKSGILWVLKRNSNKTPKNIQTQLANNLNI